MGFNFTEISAKDVDALRKEQRKRGYAEKAVKEYMTTDLPIAAFPISDITTGTQQTAKTILVSAIKKLKLEDKCNVIMLQDEDKIALSTTVS